MPTDSVSARVFGGGTDAALPSLKIGDTSAFQKTKQEALFKRAMTLDTAEVMLVHADDANKELRGEIEHANARVEHLATKTTRGQAKRFLSSQTVSVPRVVGFAASPVDERLARSDFVYSPVKGLREQSEQGMHTMFETSTRSMLSTAINKHSPMSPCKNQVSNILLLNSVGPGTGLSLSHSTPDLHGSSARLQSSFRPVTAPAQSSCTTASRSSTAASASVSQLNRQELEQELYRVKARARTSESRQRQTQVELDACMSELLKGGHATTLTKAESVNFCQPSPSQSDGEQSILALKLDVASADIFELKHALQAKTEELRATATQYEERLEDQHVACVNAHGAAPGPPSSPIKQVMQQILRKRGIQYKHTISNEDMNAKFATSGKLRGVVQKRVPRKPPAMKILHVQVPGAGIDGHDEDYVSPPGSPTADIEQQLYAQRVEDQALHDAAELAKQKAALEEAEQTKAQVQMHVEVLEFELGESKKKHKEQSIHLHKVRKERQGLQEKEQSNLGEIKDLKAAQVKFKANNEKLTTANVAMLNNNNNLTKDIAKLKKASAEKQFEQEEQIEKLRLEITATAAEHAKFKAEVDKELHSRVEKWKQKLDNQKNDGAAAFSSSAAAAREETKRVQAELAAANAAMQELRERLAMIEDRCTAESVQLAGHFSDVERIGRENEALRLAALEKAHENDRIRKANAMGGAGELMAKMEEAAMYKARAEKLAEEVLKKDAEICELTTTDRRLQQAMKQYGTETKKTFEMQQTYFKDVLAGRKMAEEANAELRVQVEDLQQQLGEAGQPHRPTMSPAEIEKAINMAAEARIARSLQLVHAEVDPLISEIHSKLGVEADDL